MGRRDDKRTTGYARYGRPFEIGKPVCRVCGQPIRAARREEHADCEKEIQRRLDQSVPNPRRQA